MVGKKKKEKKFIDLGRAESEKFEPTSEVRQEFNEAARLTGEGRLTDATRSRQLPSTDLLENALAASVDEADMRESGADGETAQDQSEVDELGKAVGLTYQDDEPLHTTEKVEGRDRHRWELDPASSEGFDERMKHEGEYEEK